MNALTAGEEADPNLVAKARQRSIHNNYLTLPVILLMISNHYPLLYATRFNWLIIAIVLALGPVIRHFYNSRNAGKGNPWWVWIVAAIGLLIIGYLSTLGPRPTTETPAISSFKSPATFAAVQDIIISRCSMCHAEEPVWATKSLPREAASSSTTPSRFIRNASLIELAAVRSTAMPPGNVTEMTDEERQLIASWWNAGMPSQ